MPAFFCLAENFDQSAAFLNDLRQRLNLSTTGRRVPSRKSAIKQIGRYVAFESMQKITPSAALVLAAEYDRARRLRQSKLWLVNVDKWNSEVFRVLFDIGFFDVLGVGKTPEREDDTDIRILRIRTGRTHDPDEIGNLLDGLSALFQQLGLGESEASLHLYGVLSEAMENVVHHAYPENGSLSG